jgi:hypothetical protein
LGENREAENSPEVVENGTWDKNPEMVKMAETASEWEKENGFELANYKFDKDIQEGKKKKDKITPNEHEHEHRGFYGIQFLYLLQHILISN